MTWPTAQLADLADGKGALVDGPFGSNLKASEYTHEGVPIIRLQNIRPNAFLSKDIKFVSTEKAKQLDRHNYKAGDLVIAKLGDPCGMTCVIPDLGASGVIVADVVRFRGRNIDHNFLSYYLNSAAGQAQFARRAKGATRQRVNLADIKEIVVPVPPPEEQRRIVDLLSRAENIVRMRREAEQKAKEIIPALFLDMFGDPATNPKGWETATFGETKLMQIIDGDRGTKYPTKADFSAAGDCLFLNTSNVRQGSWDFAKCDFISVAKDRELRKGKLIRDDVILTTRGTLGNSAHYDSAVPYDVARINSGMVILRTNSEHLLPGYLLGILNSADFSRQMIGLTSGSAQPQLPISRLTKITFVLPPKAQQGLFVERAKGAREMEMSQEGARILARGAFQSLLAGVFGTSNNGGSVRC